MNSVTVKMDGTAPTFDAALHFVWQRLNENDVPDDGKRVGIQSEQTEPFEWCGIRFGYDRRLGRGLVIAWHEDAVIPPATVLQPKGIVHCSVVPWPRD